MSMEIQERNPGYNREFLFIPFDHNIERTKAVSEALDREGIWKSYPDYQEDTRYLFRYVAEKFNPNTGDKCQCRHFTFEGWSRDRGLLRDECYTVLWPKDPIKSYDFEICAIHLFLFETNVGIIAWELQMKTPADPDGFLSAYDIAEAEYLLKKIEKKSKKNVLLPKSCLCPEENTVYPEHPGRWATTMLDLTGRAVTETCLAGHIGEFFYFCARERKKADDYGQVENRPLYAVANMMSYTEVDGRDRPYIDDPSGRSFSESAVTDSEGRMNLPLRMPMRQYFAREIFYLRNEYHKTFTYMLDRETDDKENYEAAPDTLWGISSEGVACIHDLTYREDLGDKKERFYERFRGNVRTKYMLLYVIVLHQKYVLYRFLTKVGNGVGDDLPGLEHYQTDLNRYKAEFFFTVVSEIQSHQKLYQKWLASLELDELYQDVHEPLAELAAAKARQKEKEEQELEAQREHRENAMNNSIGVLAILGIFSALIDSVDFVTDVFGWNELGPALIFAKLACIAVIAVVAVPAVTQFMQLKREDKKLSTEREPDTDPGQKIHEHEM